MDGTDANIVSMIGELLPKSGASPAEHLQSARACYAFIKQPVVFRWAMTHPKFLMATLNKAFEFEISAIHHDDEAYADLMESIREIRQQYESYFRNLGQCMLVGLISMASPLREVDGSVIEQIVKYAQLEVRISAIMSQISDGSSFCYCSVPREDKPMEKLFEIYRAPHRWAQMWFHAAAKIPICLPDCEGLICSTCLRVRFASDDKHRICNVCGRHMYVERTHGTSIPPWIDIDTYSAAISPDDIDMKEIADDQGIEDI